MSLATAVLADSGSGPGAGLGLIVFLVLLVACILLFRSMSGRIKRLPASFDSPAADSEDKPVSSPDAAGSP
jgi:hypothetical protein